MKIIKAQQFNYYMLSLDGLHVNFDSFEHRDGNVMLIRGNEISGIAWQDKAAEFFRTWRAMQCQ